jgi:hypothetical protein
MEVSMSEGPLQKVESVMFQINQDGETGVGLIWKGGTLYLSISELMLTDGEKWYSIPFAELEDISKEEEGVELRIEGANIRIKGENAERLMALRHLLLPLVEKKPENEELMVDVIKLYLIGIKDKEVIASLLKRTVVEIDGVIKNLEKDGYMSENRVTEKGVSLLSEEDIETLKKAGVRI